jgi:hypothetical protein
MANDSTGARPGQWRRRPLTSTGARHRRRGLQLGPDGGDIVRRPVGYHPVEATPLADGGRTGQALAVAQPAIEGLPRLRHRGRGPRRGRRHRGRGRGPRRGRGGRSRRVVHPREQRGQVVAVAVIVAGLADGRHRGGRLEGPDVGQDARQDIGAIHPTGVDADREDHGASPGNEKPRAGSVPGGAGWKRRGSIQAGMKPRPIGRSGSSPLRSYQARMCSSWSEKAAYSRRSASVGS